MNAAPKLPGLSASQREIMEIVWDRREVSAVEVREILASRRKLAKNTVRTLLDRMESKGWLKHREHGRTYLYSAAQPRAASIGQKVLEVVDQVCGGSAETLVATLLDVRGLRPDELRRIRKLLDQAKSNKATSGDSQSGQLPIEKLSSAKSKTGPAQKNSTQKGRS